MQRGGEETYPEREMEYLFTVHYLEQQHRGGRQGPERTLRKDEKMLGLPGGLRQADGDELMQGGFDT